MKIIYAVKKAAGDFRKSTPMHTDVTLSSIMRFIVRENGDALTILLKSRKRCFLKSKNRTNMKLERDIGRRCIIIICTSEIVESFEK